jgi:methyl-accepting chemotaxis protein
MTLRNAVIWVLTIAALVGGGFMMNLMYDLTRQVGLMTSHVASLARNVTEINHKIGAMTEHMAHMDRNMEAMARHMGRIDQTIHQGGETFQQWNPMDMMRPKGSGGR